MTRTDRAVAGLLDFLTAMVIVVGAITVYFTASAALLDVQDEGGGAAPTAGLRAEERLVDDVLRADTADALLAPECARDFFRAAGNRRCGFRDYGTGQSFLRGVLGVGDAYALNATLEDAAGVYRGAHGEGPPYRHSIGPAPPGRESVTVYDRLVTFGTDDDGDGRIDYYTVSLRLWEVA